MNLYLTSSFRGEGVAKMVMDDIEQKLGKSADEIRLAYITTAGNLHPTDKRRWIDEGREILKKRGWQVFDYDIEGKTEDEVRSELAERDVVFVQGGQCIYMLERMRKCNFAEVIKEVLVHGVPYIGESTGSILAGRDVEAYRFLAKDRRVNPPDLDSYQGLGLVNFLVRPHWANKEKFRRYAENIMGNFEKFFAISEPIIFLNDNQLVYVEDDKFQIWEG